VIAELPKDWGKDIEFFGQKVEVLLLSPKDGDIVVLEYPKPLPQHAGDSVRRGLEKFFRDAGYKVTALVCDGGAKLKVVRPDCECGGTCHEI